MPGDLMARARSGDGEAFRALTEQYRRELNVHCYRMLGSLQDAEDATQETLLAAWRGLVGFEERASLRTWLYRIATNRCLNARRSAGRRSAKEWDVPGVEPPEPSRLGEVATVHAMTVHRAQGSQFAEVSILLPPPQSPLLTRELLYTAVSRATATVHLIGSEAAIRRAAPRPANRASGLSQRLAD